MFARVNNALIRGEGRGLNTPPRTAEGLRASSSLGSVRRVQTYDAMRHVSLKVRSHHPRLSGQCCQSLVQCFKLPVPLPSGRCYPSGSERTGLRWQWCAVAVDCPPHPPEHGPVQVAFSPIVFLHRPIWFCQLGLPLPSYLYLLGRMLGVYRYVFSTGCLVQGPQVRIREETGTPRRTYSAHLTASMVSLLRPLMATFKFTSHIATTCKATRGASHQLSWTA